MTRNGKWVLGKYKCIEREEMKNVSNIEEEDVLENSDEEKKTCEMCSNILSEVCMYGTQIA